VATPVNTFLTAVLSEDMYKEGYTNITNIDFSTIVIEDMQLKYRNLNYDESFECTRGGRA